ncbi:hypothetical protein FACS1894202_08300 [Clostridia bacterium]|nr:hypothetical protein FACS1894202_08300 [Clostridia bacterium]
MNAFTVSDNEYMKPASDVVFSFMFADEYLFTSLVRAVTGIDDKLVEKPLSQATIRNPVGKLVDRLQRRNTIRFDVQANGENGSYALEMQKQYSRETIVKRGMFYSARLYGEQRVERGRYAELKPAIISFIMSDAKDTAGSGIHRLCVTDTATGELLDDVMCMYQVFVPTIINSPNTDKGGDLYTMARFFAIKEQGGADAFMKDLGDTQLGKELAVMYSTAVKHTRRLLGLRDNEPHFTRKDVALAESRAAQVERELTSKLERLQRENAQKVSQLEKLESKATQAESKATQFEKKATQAESKATQAEKKATQAEQKTSKIFRDTVFEPEVAAVIKAASSYAGSDGFEKSDVVLSALARLKAKAGVYGLVVAKVENEFYKSIHSGIAGRGNESDMDCEL